ncbi:unnamed protein product [Eruca vesicaria subsp. sativa]|uniref:CP-type G domain-containing protein n=1 Tax=Eruca vesicaria subsp. sativa TaxID=29727 RepID=A0ABC8K057_ERUVS|nr:unnamed protein product [Eruca vesicaria subsp. sativa]
MGKNEKTSLGRALVKHHNHAIQETKEKGKHYQNKKVLESVTEVSDIDAIIEQAEEAERLFHHDESATPVPINMDAGSSSSGVTAKEWKEQRMREEALHATSLQVPRRPPWTPKMNVEQLDANEKRAFLTWRRKLASLEENEKLVLTPFEKNLDIWRQLWRVLERSDLIVMVVDARDPLFYRCPDLEAYAREIDEHKETMLLVNKADLLPPHVREKWAEYFTRNNILFVFWSAKAATATLEGKPLKEQWTAPETSQKTDDPAVKVYGRDELLDRLKFEAQEIVKMRKARVETSHGERVVVGFVGYPNVGKSSTINALVGQKRTGVTSTPGKTKHFQTLIISEELMLCDCPGLVFPSFSSSRYDMIACGVLPIDRMTEHREAVKVVAERVPRDVIEQVYNISLPKPKSYESRLRPPLASEVLRTYCLSRGYVAASGLPDETRAARQILKDYIEGKLPHFAMPPEEESETDKTGDGSQSEVNEEARGGLGLGQVLEDLSSFDLANGIGYSKKKQVESHKQLKKTQRKN